MSAYKGIIFDLDGTLADTLPLCITAFRQSVEPLTGKPITDEAIIATFGPSEEGTIMKLIPDHYDQGVADYLRFYETLHEMCPAPFEGVHELLQRLQSQGRRIAMVTGKGPHSTAISLRRFGLSDVFEIIETGAPEGPRKPQGIAHVLQEWADLKPEEIVYIGDAPSDIAASRQAGIPVIAAAWAATADPETLKAMHPDAICYSIEALADLLS